MADDKDNRGARDRATVSASETYEIDYFARKHKLSHEQAQTLIDRVGNSREALEAAVAEDSKAVPKKRGRPPKAPGSAPGADTVQNKPVAKSKKAPATDPSTSIADTVAGVTTPVMAAVSTAAKPVVDPVTKAIAPVAKDIAATPRKVSTAVTPRLGVGPQGGRCRTQGSREARKRGGPIARSRW